MSSNSVLQPFDLDRLIEEKLELSLVQQQPEHSLVCLETLPSETSDLYPPTAPETLPLLLLDGEEEVDTDIDVDKDTENEDSDCEQAVVVVVEVQPQDDDVELIISCLKSLTANHQEQLSLHQEKLSSHETKMVIKRLKLVRTFEASRGKLTRQLEDSIVRRAKNVSIRFAQSENHLKTQLTIAGWNLG